MHTRTTPRILPNRPHSFLVEVPGRGEHWFRRPSALLLAEVLGSSTSLLTMLATALAEDIDLEAPAPAIIARLQYVTPKALIYSGITIGLAWCHETLDLDTERGDDVEAFGRGVYEELHEEGYSPGVITLLATYIGQQINEANQFEMEVQERLDFFAEARAGKTASPSTSDGSTSETSSGTTA